MRKLKFRVALLAAILTLPLVTAAGAAGESPLLKIMQTELTRNFQKLEHADSIPLYYLAYQVVDEREVNLGAELGALTGQSDVRGRYLDVSLRVGDYRLDNTHQIPEGSSRGFGPASLRLPLDDNATAVRLKLWEATDQKYRDAEERFTKVVASTAVKVEAEDTSADFSHEQPAVFIGEPAALRVEQSLWAERIKRLSQVFLSHPEVERSSVSFSSRTRNSYFVSSEGSKIQQGQTFVRLGVSCSATAEDGMQLSRFRSFDAAEIRKLPSDSVVMAAINQLIDELSALRKSPLAEPYSGPAILTGPASAVFFHEIFGHRIEGHRQKSEFEGQTFTKKVGEKVLPDFISVYSDPTRREFNGVDLRGFYLYDDEGIPAQDVVVVQNGVLKNFLMSRSPINNFPHSNGHGRKWRGFDPVGRQSNLIVESSRSVPFDTLKQMLLAECRRQNKPYGLIFKDISGGFTFTGRFLPQAFKVLPLMVYKVYVENGREELIRGVDIVGTPLTSFGKILMAGNDPDVFNGTCGAESGWVPVAAISPSLLLSEIEIERRQKEQDRPPLLPSPLSQPQ